MRHEDYIVLRCVYEQFLRERVIDAQDQRILAYLNQQIEIREPVPVFTGEYDFTDQDWLPEDEVDLSSDNESWLR